MVMQINNISCFGQSEIFLESQCGAQWVNIFQLTWAAYSVQAMYELSLRAKSRYNIATTLRPRVLFDDGKLEGTLTYQRNQPL